MEIRCKNCGKIHTIDDSAIANKKIFFFCTSCNHKVTVDGRKSTADTVCEKINRPVSEQPAVSSSQPNFTDVFKGFHFGFSAPNIILGIIFITAISLFTAIIFLLKKKFPLFFFDHYKISIIIAFTVALFFYFLYSLFNYFISRIIHFKENNPGRKIDLKLISYDFRDDIGAIFTVSAGTVLLITLTAAPFFILKKFSLVYIPFGLPLMALFFFFFIAALILNNYLMAAIATESFFFKDSVRSVFKFVFREFFNIPFYSFIIELIILFFYSIILGAIVLSFSFASAVSASLSKGEILSGMKLFLENFVQKFMGAAPAEIPVYISIGGILTLISLFLIISAMYSSLLNVRQALHTQAVIIMKRNPSLSVNRYILIVFMVGVLVCAGIWGNEIFSLFSSFVKKISLLLR